MNPDALNQFMQEYPEVVLALIQMLMQMDKEQLTQLVQTLQQMAEAKGVGSGNGRGDAVTSESDMNNYSSQEDGELSEANSNLYGN